MRILLTLTFFFSFAFAGETPVEKLLYQARTEEIEQLDKYYEDFSLESLLEKTGDFDKKLSKIYGTYNPFSALLTVTYIVHEIYLREESDEVAEELFHFLARFDSHLDLCSYAFEHNHNKEKSLKNICSVINEARSYIETECPEKVIEIGRAHV